MGRADEQRVGPVQLRRIALSRAQALGQDQKDGRNEPRDADESWGPVRCLHRVAYGESDDCGRHAARDDQPQPASCRGIHIARRSENGDVGKSRVGQLGDAPTQHDHDREQRPEVHDEIEQERGARGFPRRQQVVGDREVPRGRNRQEFRRSLQNPQSECLE